jgi:HNH endonuclease
MHPRLASGLQADEHTRCTYCRESKLRSAFTRGGDHVVPASLGGGWVDPRVCGECNERANEVADELVGKDFLVRFLRAVYEVPDRYGKRPSPPVFSLRLPPGGVVKATLHVGGPTFEAGLPSSVAESLALEDPTDQERLKRIFAQALGAEEPTADQGSLELARAAQKRATPPQAWSRLIAKLGLACGRQAYGDAWLDTRQARTLSHDLLTDGPPRFSQRTHHPPVERSWPYEPPKHQLWIQPHEDIAVLMVALFGQVLGAVPINDLPVNADPSAWSLDPHSRTFHRSTYPAIWLANAASRIQEAGGTPYVIADREHPFIYTPDGPDGPVDLGVAADRAESPRHALEIAKRPAAETDGESKR